MAKTRTIIRWTISRTSVGPLLVAASDRGVCRVAFHEDQSDLSRHHPEAELLEGGEEIAALVKKVISAIESPSSAEDIALDLAGTDFQKAVWSALQAIPRGETRTYAQIAAAVGRPGAVRAAGSANGANPIAVLIPCHRVIRSDGTLGGYAYGAQIKRALLEREGAFPMG